MLDGAKSISKLKNETLKIGNLDIPFSMHPYTNYFSINNKEVKIGFNFEN